MPKRRLYTRKSSNAQNDKPNILLLISTRFKSKVHKVKNYQGTACASDHVAVFLDYCMKLKKILQPQKERKFNLEMVTKYDKIQNTFKLKTKNCFESVEDIVKDGNISINED